MNSSVIVFPGSNCDRDIATALTKLQFKNKMVWHKDNQLPKSDLIVIPGGFSYGDYLRSGAIAAKSNILKEVIKAANAGCLVLGICNGFQILTETGLLKGVLLRNKNLKFINKNVSLKVTNNKTKFTNKYKNNQVININIAHNEGNYFTSPKHLEKLTKENLIAFKYCNEKGDINENSNPNGSLENIAGIFNSNKNILGMMPHPERMIDNLVSKSKKLTDYLVFLLKSLETNRIEIITPIDRGCQISIKVVRTDQNLFKKITDYDVIADWREPDVIRIAPVPLYNSFFDVWSFYYILNKLLVEK